MAMVPAWIVSSALAEWPRIASSLISKEEVTNSSGVTTTPVDADVPNVRLRQESDVVAYNAAAGAIAEELGIGVVDLHGAVKPRIVPAWRRGGALGDVHFSEEANRFLAAQMVAAITAALAATRE